MVLRSYANIINMMMENGLIVNWTTILVGWDGPGRCQRQLTIEDIVRYALTKIDHCPENERDQVLLLIGVTEGNESIVSNILHALSSIEKGDLGLEHRKWRLMLLKQVLDEVGSDPIYDLIKLTEFWERFGYPADAPHIVQGRGNALSPSDYYSDANLRDTVRRHEEWAQNEMALLSSK